MSVVATRVVTDHYGVFISVIEKQIVYGSVDRTRAEKIHFPRTATIEIRVGVEISDTFVASFEYTGEIRNMFSVHVAISFKIQEYVQLADRYRPISFRR